MAILTILVSLLAWWGQNGTLAMAAAVLGIYALHLISIRLIMAGQADNKARLETQWKLLQLLVDPNALDLGDLPSGKTTSAPPAVRPGATSRLVASPVRSGAPGNPDASRVNGAGEDAGPAGPEYRIPTPRHFALGTVALIRNMLSPAQVARILVEQRQQPDKKFATLAVELGMLTDAQREELLLAQQEGLFSDAEMREARERLREFRKTTAKALAEHE
ncbi:MAG: hypothetical protein ACODAA_06530 [Gemmatimonadota bacterium]